MARADYGPGRRRKSTLAWLLDWAAGVLVGILALMIGAAILSLFIPTGVERVAAFRTMSALVWPLGAALGVWLCIGKPLRGRELAFGLLASAAAVGVAWSPIALGVDSSLARVGGSVFALVSAPACARLAIVKLRGRGESHAAR